VTQTIHVHLLSWRIWRRPLLSQLFTLRKHEIDVDNSIPQPPSIPPRQIARLPDKTDSFTRFRSRSACGTYLRPRASWARGPRRLFTCAAGDIPLYTTPSDGQAKRGCN
jgi:hypothetical protein